MGMVDVSNYNKIKEDAANWYHRIGRVAAPVFGSELVHFTSEGFNHLVYKNARTERSKAAQITKFRLLGNSLKLIKTATTFQEYEESIKEFSVQKFRKRVLVPKIVKYWGLIAIMDTWKIKVIVRQVGNGNKHFWSAIPNWTTSQYRDLKYLANMKGNPEED